MAIRKDTAEALAPADGFTASSAKRRFKAIGKNANRCFSIEARRTGKFKRNTFKREIHVDQRKAINNFYSPDPAGELMSAGFLIERYNSDSNWVVKRDGVVIQYWPTANKWM